MIKTVKSIFLITPIVLFLGCGDNTENQVLKDVKSIDINSSDLTIYSTDKSKTLSASVTYSDGTTSTINTPDLWTNSDYDVLNMYNGIITPSSNGGNSKVGIKVGSLSDEIDVEIVKLTDFNISNTDINTTGEYYTLEATGTFEDNTTKIISTNIIWLANNNATIINEDNLTKISLVSGDTNVTATLFGETNSSATIGPKIKTYSIN